MSNLQTVRVWAIGDGLVPAVDALGNMTRTRRYVGRSDDGTPKSEGDLVPDCIYIRSCIRDGSLSLTNPTTEA